jgi:hypothetical protein
MPVKVGLSEGKGNGGPPVDQYEWWLIEQQAKVRVKALDRTRWVDSNR